MLATNTRAILAKPVDTPPVLRLWALSVGLALWGIGLTWVVDYQVHDADSRLYIALSQELAARPWAQWCAPVWHGHWGREGLFVEHPPGLFWVGAILNRCGMPPHIALYAVNQAAWLLGLGLLLKLGTALASRRAACAAVVIWCSSPAFVQYLVRGDQEHPLTTSLMLGLVAITCSRRPVILGLLWGTALGLALAFKGLPALALLPLGITIGYVQRICPRRWAALALGTACAALAAGLYEWWYQAQTGQSFVMAYLTAQVGPSLGHRWSWTNKLVNLCYYVARPVWFAQPAAALMAWGLWHRLMRGVQRPFGGLGFSLGTAALALFVAAFTLADRKADRYLFPAYPIVALSAAVQLEALTFENGRLARAWRFVESQRACVLGAVVLAAVIGLKVYIGTYHYVFVRVWPGA